MSSPPSQLATLSQQLMLHADRTLLDAPLDALGERVHDELVRELLRGMYEAGEADSLAHLLAGDRLERWVSDIATQREEHALCGELRRWLGLAQFGSDDPARWATTEPLPNDLEGVLRWARPYDLLGELTRPASEVLTLPGLPPEASLLACCLGQCQPERGASLIVSSRVTEQARAYLQEQAARFAALPARVASWQHKPEAGPLRDLTERLLAVVSRNDLAAIHGLRFVPARPVSVDRETGACQGHLRTLDDHAAPIRVRLYLAGYEQRALHSECDTCQEPRCLHVRALAARLVDACLTPQDILQRDLLEFLRVPSWRRFLQALRVEAASESESSDRLCFRVRLDGERASVGVVVQQPLRDGRMSAGKVSAPQRLLREGQYGARDRAALEALCSSHRTLSGQFAPADVILLRALAEHPQVQLDGSGEPLRVSEHALEVQLVEQPAGLLPKVLLGGAAVPAGQRAAELGYVLRYEAVRGTLIFGALTSPLRRLLGALAHFHGVLPPESYPLLAPWLSQLRQVAQVTAPNVLRGTERPTPRRLLLRIAPTPSDGIDVTLCVRALALSPLWSPGQGPTLDHGLEQGVQVFARRDLDWERSTAQHVQEQLGLHEHIRLEPFAYRVETTQAALALLSRAAQLHELLDIEWAERSRKLNLSAAIGSRDLKVRLFKSGRWLELHGGARHKEQHVALDRLFAAVRRGERYVLVEGDTYAEIERELFERLQQAQLCVMTLPKGLGIAKAAAPYWLERLGGVTDGDDADTRDWLALLASPQGTSDEPADAVYNDPVWIARLRGYQREGLRWLLDQSRWAPGVCLADEMGLGKTVQAIALLEARAQLGAAMVIAPTSVVANWVAELARFAPDLRVLLYRGARRHERLETLAAGTVLLTSYELLLRDRTHFEGRRFATQIIDEAQMIKNAATRRARAVRGIASEFRVALSGTPIENRLGDLWSLFALIAPGLLGSWSSFRSRFAVPIERYDKDERASALRALVAPFILRRTKDQVAKELPSRTEVVHWVELSTAEQDLYDAAAQRARRALGKRRDEESRTVRILAELTHLRQLACHPRLVIEDERLESSKLAALLRLFEDILPRGHRVLLFSQFTRHLALVRQALDAAAISCLYFDGGTPVRERADLVERFQGGEAQVFLISLKAGGTGLNLTAADYVVHMDPWWNPAAEDQASDRAHRFGQERPLTIVKLVTQRTIEERVLELHGHKRELAHAILGSETPPLQLDRDTLEALLG